MSFNSAALYSCPQTIPSSYQAHYEPPPPRRPRASTMTQDANTQWHRNAQRMPGLPVTDNFQPPILSREYSSMWDDVEIQNDWANAAREQGMSMFLFTHDVLVQSQGAIQSTRVSYKSSVPLITSNTLVRTRNTNTSLWTLNEDAAHLLTENVHGMNLLIANKEVARPLTKSVHGMNLSIMSEGDVCILIDRKNALDLLITNKSVVHLLTASDSIVNLAMANKGIVLLST